jgi:hypothetical protein
MVARVGNPSGLLRCEETWSFGFSDIMSCVCFRHSMCKILRLCLVMSRYERRESAF